MNSAKRLLRKDEYPSLKLPKLPMKVTSTLKRKSPRRRQVQLSFEDKNINVDADILSTGVDVSNNTEITVNDLEQMTLEISRLKQ